MTFDNAACLSLAAGLAIAGGVLGWARRDRRKHEPDAAQEPDDTVVVADGDLVDDLMAVAEAVDVTPVAPGRLLETGGYVKLGTQTVHRDCADARRDGQAASICVDCGPVLFGSATQPRPAPGHRSAEDTTVPTRPCSVCGKLTAVGQAHRCGKGEDLRPERVA